jgi:hypothetical protein
MAMNGRLILFGYMLTDDMMASVKEHIISRLTDLGKEEYVSIRNQAMECSTHLNGMLHVKMHNLVVIYWFFYGAFLQAIQAELRYKWIQQNPMKGHFKDHEIFARLVFNALDVWLQTTEVMDEGGIGGNDSLVLVEASFQAFCDLQLTSPDEMTWVAANFMRDFSAFE